MIIACQGLLCKLDLSLDQLASGFFGMFRYSNNGCQVAQNLMLNAHSLLLSLIGPVAFNLAVDGHFE